MKHFKLITTAVIMLATVSFIGCGKDKNNNSDDNYYDPYVNDPYYNNPNDLNSPYYQQNYSSPNIFRGRMAPQKQNFKRYLEDSGLCNRDNFLNANWGTGDCGNWNDIVTVEAYVYGNQYPARVSIYIRPGSNLSVGGNPWMNSFGSSYDYVTMPPIEGMLVKDSNGAITLESGWGGNDIYSRSYTPHTMQVTAKGDLRKKAITLYFYYRGNIGSAAVYNNGSY